MTTRNIAIALAVSLAISGCAEDDRSVSTALSAVPAFFYVDENGDPLAARGEAALPVEKIVAGARVPVTAPDGHTLSWQEWGGATGTAAITCQEGGTRVLLEAEGLVPGGLYTGWINSFVAPGFTEAGLAAFGGLSPLGAPDGSESIVVADAEGNASLETVTPAGPLAFVLNDEVEDVPACMLDGYEVALDLTLHLDGNTYGPFPGDDDTNADHLLWGLREGVPEPI